MLILIKGAKKQLVIKPTQGSWGTRDIDRTIHNMQEKQMITWHYLKRVKERSSKRKVPIWFKSIENQIITNFDTKEIKQDLQTMKVSEDKPKLDWILVNNKENKLDIRRVISKSKEEFRTEKWLVSKEEKDKIRIDKEAIILSNTQQTEWINNKKVLQGLRKQNSSWVLDMTQSLLEEIRKNTIDPEIT
ncbi:10235_t:CDS:2, partial [Dentiscutata erythropus]